MEQSNAFVVSPMSKTVELKPGDKYEDYLLVTNPQDATKDFHYKISVAPYGIVGDGNMETVISIIPG